MATAPTSTTPSHRNAQAVVVLGASPKPERYSNRAIRMLQAAGYRVIPVHPKAAFIESEPVVHDLATINEAIHTLTMYVGAARSAPLTGAILRLNPGRVIFNPGSESAPLETALTAQGIPCIHGCTLVMLSTGQF
jgi:predicted CoA-binding protein